MGCRLMQHGLLGILATLALTASSIAHGGVFRAYLSANGYDANPCTVQWPCRFLPAALAAVNDGGEIWMVDSATFNTAPVKITKSVTILAIPGAHGSVVASGGDALNIDGPGVKVTLRNLLLLHLSLGFSGVNFTQGADLTIEQCEISGMPFSGVYASAPNGSITIKDTVIRNNDTGVNVQGSVSATLDRVLLLTNSSFGLYALSGPRVTVVDSVVANQDAGGIASGIYIVSVSGQRTQMVVERSELRGNTSAVFADTFGSGSSVQIALSHNIISHNTAGYRSSGASGTSIATLLDNNAVSHNATGIDIGFGIVDTRQNNTFLFNTTNVNGSLTPLSPL